MAQPVSFTGILGEQLTCSLDSVMLAERASSRAQLSPSPSQMPHSSTWPLCRATCTLACFKFHSPLPEPLDGALRWSGPCWMG